MKFNEMLIALKAGKKIKRESWNYEEGYLVLMPGMPAVWKILVAPSANAGNHLFIMEEFYADDWKTIDSFESPISSENGAENDQ